jgi:threonyl-tRNA synthetase
VSDQVHIVVDGEPRQVPAGATAGEALRAAGVKGSVVVRVGLPGGDPGSGELRDLAHPVRPGDVLESVPAGSPAGRSVIRHSCAHVLAQAVQELFPGTLLGIGPPIENGFYYDFRPDRPFTPEDLAALEKRMSEIIRQRQRFSRRVVTPTEAEAELAHEKFKLELIELAGAPAGEVADGAAVEVGGTELTMYDNLVGENKVWTDLCRGPHLATTRDIPAFTLTRTAAAYWRGSEKNPQLQRIYGTAWESKDALKAYLTQLEEAERRDHRKIGADLDLFTFSAEIGRGLPIWLPNGMIIRDELEQWAKETERAWGYQRIGTPHLTRSELYFISGHLPYYQEDLYAPIDIEGDQYFLKPMNCPHHHMAYKARPRSYRELPLRLAEYGTVYRYERSGQLYGLMRTRGFSQNDAHIYCTLDQAKQEFVEVMRLHDYYYRALGIDDFHMVLALRDPKNTEKYHGDEQMWATAEQITREAMDESGIPYVEDVGGAAHYGPKVDFIIRSVTGREFAASTNQIDLYMPQRFDLTYHAADGTEQTAVVVHRAPLGSHERFVAYLIEHFAGAFPVWLAPEQVRVVPLTDAQNDYAHEVAKRLFDDGLRASVDDSDGRMQAKVRHAVLKKVPFVLVVGQREAAEQTVSVRPRGASDQGATPLADFHAKLRRLVDTRSLTLD